jgi:hypothetical protein
MQELGHRQGLEQEHMQGLEPKLELGHMLGQEPQLEPERMPELGLELGEVRVHNLVWVFNNSILKIYLKIIIHES